MAHETVQLACYAAGLRSDNLPAEVVGCAKDCIIDTAATCIHGSALPWSRGGAGGTPACGQGWD